MRLTAAFFAVSLAAGALLAGTNESGFNSTPLFSAQVHGDFDVTSIALLRDGSGPFTFGVSGVPDGATIVKAYINYITVTETPGSEAEKSVNFAGFNVTSIVSGTGSLTGLIGDSVASYTADVTPFITGNDGYPFTLNIDPPANTDNNKPLYEGASLVVVYDTGTGPLKQVNIYDGLTHTLGGLPAAGLLDLSPSYQGGPLHFFLDAGDGQPELTDQFTINGVFPSISGLNTADNSFIDLVGSSWDAPEGDISALVAPGATSITFNTGGYQGTGDDYVVHGLAAVSYELVPEPTSLLILALAGLTLIPKPGHSRER